MAAAAALIFLVAMRPGGSDAAAHRPAEEWSSNRPVSSALTVPQPHRLSDREDAFLWTTVRHSTLAYSHPRSDSQPVARLGVRTEDGTANVVSVESRTDDAAGRGWVKVSLPILPAGSYGWIPRRAAGGYASVRTYLRIDLETMRATLYRGGRSIFSAAVGIGRPQSPTPRGRFFIRSRLTRYRSPTYGPLAFGTSARSAVLTEWPGGGFVGIHGTDRPELIPGPISHGCIRMRNEDILRLGKLLPVGTPVGIE